MNHAVKTITSYSSPLNLLFLLLTAWLLVSTPAKAELVSEAKYHGSDKNFDGTRKEYLNPTPISDLTHWSLTAWVNPAESGVTKMVLSNDIGGWNDDVLLGISPEGSGVGCENRWTIIHQDSANQVRTKVCDTEDVIVSQWYHIVVTADGETLRLYVNGVEKGNSVRNGATLNFNAAPVAVGVSGNGTTRTFKGDIAEVSVSDSVFSAIQVSALFAKPNAYLAPSNSNFNGARLETMTDRISQWSIVAIATPKAAGDGRTVLTNDIPGWHNDVLFGISPESASIGCTNRWSVIHQDKTNSVRTVACDTEDVVLNASYTVIATADGDHLKLYVNGVEKASVAKAGASLDFNNAPIYIGGSNIYSTRFFDGDIDDVSFYHRTLSTLEVTQLSRTVSETLTINEYIGKPEDFDGATAIEFYNGLEIVTSIYESAFRYRTEGSSNAFSYSHASIDVNKPHSVKFVDGYLRVIKIIDGFSPDFDHIG